MLFPEGIAAQPGVLAHSAATVRAALDAVAALPPRAVVALTGIGASEHIARSAASAWRGDGLRAVAVSASEPAAGDRAGLADVYVALSESGRSAETVAAMSRAATGGVRRVGVTNGPDSPLAAALGVLALVVASAALQPLDAAGAIEPYLPTVHWLAWIDLYRDPILWTAVREGAAVQAGYVLVAFGAAWANFATKDVTS